MEVFERYVKNHVEDISAGIFPQEVMALSGGNGVNRRAGSRGFPVFRPMMTARWGGP